MPYFKPYEIFMQETTNALMCALLIADVLQTEGPVRAPPPSLLLSCPGAKHPKSEERDRRDKQRPQLPQQQRACAHARMLHARPPAAQPP